MTKNILERYGGDLCKQADQNGWTPLHMAAYLGCIEPTKLLLQYGREVAYMKDAEGRTALHIAAHCNQKEVTKEIISMCPDCCEVVDNKGRNALHLAVHLTKYKSPPIAALIIQDKSSLRNLLNQKDNDGNTPLHHYCNYFNLYDERLLNSPRVDKMVFNKKNENAHQIYTSKSLQLYEKEQSLFEAKNNSFYFNGRLLKVGYDEIEKRKTEQEADVEEWEKWEKQKDEEEGNAARAQLVVATLITTVTFAAGINMPRGFIGGDDHPHPGSAIFKSAAFKAFIITDALSLMLSSSAIFLHLFIPFIPSAKSMPKERTRFLKIALGFLLSSMVPMVLAFVTCTYALLEHSNIAISTCIICLSFFPILVYIFKEMRWYVPN
ncbi:ankyrin repeat-containing protein At5g02620-like [Juglans regia]|uniref:Ankyrin repeat-containing protein At5g02620-like n=1 Tax=Juglans regia TaxID=51240 RepID=A0A6P9ETX1_JUGRE|nr:ankyrin repeat-containing protein At5g02620-like [Juglans regia]